MAGRTNRWHAWRYKLCLSAFVVNKVIQEARNSALPAPKRFLVAGWTGECVDERAGTRRVVPHLKRGVEVEDVRRSEAAAGAVDCEHRDDADFAAVYVLQHGASPV